MKRKLFFLAGGAVLLTAMFLALPGFVNQDPIKNSPSTPNSVPPTTYIQIYCSACTTSDYATILWKGWTSDCEGYTPDWIDEGTFYFNSSHTITHYLNCELYKLLANIHVYKSGAECTYSYYGTTEGDPCADTVYLSLNISYPWECPER